MMQKGVLYREGSGMLLVTLVKCSLHWRYWSFQGFGDSITERGNVTEEWKAFGTLGIEGS